MDRLIGFRSFATTALIVLAALRALHVGVPLVFPETRSGPTAVASLDDVQRRVGFAPYVPAYRPAGLGAGAAEMTVSFRPGPTFTIVWRDAGQFLQIIERRGGARPQSAAIGQTLDGFPDSTWRMDDARCHLVLPHEGLCIEIETTLPSRDLRRLADTLTRY